MSDYRIDELAEQAASALVATGTVPPSARVSALPDRRMLRYYTTIGLLDRPVEIRGRTAYYGRRHLLQIVAIKRLQATGASLGDIQQRLAGASTADLERIADLPDQAGASNGPTPARRDFWRADPSFQSPSPAEWGSLTGIPQAPALPATAAAAAVVVPVPSAVRLAPGVTLVVDAARAMAADEHEELRAAAGPLLDHLTTRGLLAAEPQER